MTVKILTADDEPYILRVLEHALTLAGYEVTTARDGVETLAAVQEYHPDLLVLDINMPRKGGIEVIRELRADPRHAALPIIILSAGAQVLEKVNGLRAGADDYVTKPVVTAELVARIEAHLMRIQRLKELNDTRRGRSIACLGVKGGVGTSTVALNLLALLDQYSPAIGVELRLTPGTWASQLHRVISHDYSPLLALSAADLDEDAVMTRMAQLSYGPRILFAPPGNRSEPEPDPARIRALLHTLTGMADFVVADLPSSLPGFLQPLLGQVDYLALVVEPTPLCLSLAPRVLELAAANGTAGSAAGVIVVQRAPRAGELHVGQLESELGCQVIGIVPYAGEACLTAEKLGTPLVLSETANPAAAALAELAGRLAGERERVEIQ